MLQNRVLQVVQAAVEQQEQVQRLVEVRQATTQTTVVMVQVTLALISAAVEAAAQLLSVVLDKIPQAATAVPVLL